MRTSALGTSGDVSAASCAFDVFVEIEPDGVTDFTADLDIASGVLVIGDADGFEQLDLGAGQWATSLVAMPADHPDDMTIWLRRKA
jgi:hypothetical protein